MSTRQYHDKSREELEPIIDAFIKNYESLFGIKLTFEAIEEKLKNAISQKEKEIFSNMFNQLTPKNLKDAIHLFKEKTEIELPKGLQIPNENDSQFQNAKEDSKKSKKQSKEKK